MSVDMQVQMRRNVDEMHASVNDLTSWASEIAKRDRSLRGMGEPDQAAKQAQALAAEEEEEEREIAAAKEELRRLYGEDQLSADGVPPPDATGGAPKPKGIGQKYDKWNNYDAEGVIKQLEEREADKERLRLEVARLENRRAQAQVRKKHEADAAAAEALKLAGNEAFAAARYEEATEKYTSALDLAPRSAVLYANRGLALLKLGAAAEAEEDCDAALMLEPSYVKARMRRAQARRSLFNYDGALEDVEAALEVEPKNAAARKMMLECRQLRATASRARPAAELQRTLEITQVTHDPANDGHEFVEVVAPPAPPPAPPPAAPPTAGPSAPDKPGAQTPATDVAATGAAASAPAAPGATAAAAASARVANAGAFGAPSSGADVERAWRSLRRSPEEWAAYVRGLEAAQLAALFKHNLPAELLSAFLAATDAYADGGAAHAAHALGTLRALSGAGRFAILTMCMDKADGKAAASVFAKLQAAHGRGELPGVDDLAALKAKYT